MSSSEFLSKLHNYIRSRHLLKMDGRYIVALSGGADSTALLLSLHRLGYKIEAAHCNFHLRGEESNRDELFSKNLCEKQNIPFHLIHFETTEYANLHKVSVEMAARQLRYAYFSQLAKDINADAVCVAHHLDDQVETVLLNLLRGTGLYGLKGMIPSRDFPDEMGNNGSVKLVRPFLEISRKEIENYLDEEKQPFVTDSTNNVNDVQRNKLRLDVIPLLKQINAFSSEHIAQTARYIAELLPLIDDATEKWLSLAKVSIDNDAFTAHEDAYNIRTLLESPSPMHLIYTLLSRHDFSSKQSTDFFEAIDHLETGRIFLSDTHEMVVNRGVIIFYKREYTFAPTKIPETGIYKLSDASKITIRTISDNELAFPLKSKTRIVVDAATLAFPLTLRVTESGDRFVPFGMKGSRLVSDFLTDIKMDVVAKRRQLVLADANGLIVWVVGQRADNRFRISDETHEIIEFTIYND